MLELPVADVPDTVIVFVFDSVPVIAAPVPVTDSTLATRSLLNVHAPAVVDFCVQSRPLPPLLDNNKEASAPDFVNEPTPVTARPVVVKTILSAVR